MNNFKFGEAFSFLNPSLLSTENKISIPTDSVNQIDEYGFENKQTIIEKNILDSAEIRYRKSKDKWMKFLEEKYQKLAPQSCHDMIKFELNFIDDETRSFLIKLLQTDSIPDDLRSFFWVRLSNGLLLKNQHEWTYSKIVEIYEKSNNLSLINIKQFKKLLSNNVYFKSGNEIIFSRLDRCLKILDNELFCKKLTENFTSLKIIKEWNFSIICSYLLLICTEEDCCWIMLKLASLPVIHICIDLVEQLLEIACPFIGKLIAEHDIDLSHILEQWFSTLFSSHISDCHLLFAIWDIFFIEGPIFLVQFTIGLFIIESKKLSTSLNDNNDSATVYNKISELPINSLSIDNDNWWKIQETLLIRLRLIWKSGKIVCNEIPNIPKFLFNYNRNFYANQLNDIQAKHIKQTSLLMQLHDTIISIKDHFQAYNPDIRYKIDLNLNTTTNNNTANNNINIKNNIYKDDNNDNYEENNRDDKIKNYPYKRAKALMNYNAENSDELNFHCNDIINVLNDQDEHCWIGEIDKNIGWFPAKLVELLDERDQEYSIAGDDRLIPFINILIRGRLCSVIKSILINDIKQRSSIYFSGTLFPIHPWSLFEELSNQLRGQSNFRVIYSRLVLNCTFHLDEYSRILKPIELLYRSIASINKSHFGAPLDVKFRTLICMGLNQYCLHDWFELLVHAAEMDLSKYFDKESILRTPVWRLIKAELKLLVQFSFHLNPNTEIDLRRANFAKDFQAQTSSPAIISKESVCDMLVKYHLFSWDSS